MKIFFTDLLTSKRQVIVINLNAAKQFRNMLLLKAINMTKHEKNYSEFLVFYYTHTCPHAYMWMSTF